MNSSDLIQPHHWQRRAAIYVRQSTPQQVLGNQESLRLQYALKERALELGWQERDIRVIDTDLGQTAATLEGRAGFQQLVAQVALGEVGILIAYDATRLARNCSHWYQLLDVCGPADCLIGDRDGVYDPSSINGRLLLGLKGQISELELHTLRARLTAGLLNKAQRGELAMTLPTGLVRLPSGEVVKHPDRQVQSRLKLVFELFLQKRSASKVVRHLKKRDLKIPRRDSLGDIQWRRPTVASIASILKNPAYAGAFVRGRSQWIKSQKTGKYSSKPLPPSQWKVCLHDKYPAYLSWALFEKIQTMLQDNYSEYHRRQSRGVPRQGQALLQGIVFCGECGHKITVRYKRMQPFYVCDHLHEQQGEPRCQYLRFDRIDRHVVHGFFEALSVAEIDLAASCLAEADRRQDQLLSARRQDVQRVRYQARLAERQYQHTDPENRLVAAELERRWEVALRELAHVEEQRAREEQETTCWAIPADLLEELKTFGPHLPPLWEQGLFSTEQKKSLLRCLIDKVVVHRIVADRVRIRVVWRGGATTSQDVRVPVQSLARLSDARQMEETILRMAREGQSDEQIARELTTRGHRSPLRDVVLPSTVQQVRLRHGVLRRPPRRRCVPGHLTITQLAKQLNISRNWIEYRIQNGTIRVTKRCVRKLLPFP